MIQLANYVMIPLHPLCSGDSRKYLPVIALAKAAVNVGSFVNDVAIRSANLL